MDLVALLAEYARRHPEATPIPGGPPGSVPTAEEVNHPGQWEMATSPAMLNAGLCSRQWGKTSAARLIARLTMAKPNSRTIYATLIRRNCKKLFWDPLLGELDEAGWRVRERVGGKKRSNDTELMLTASNGAFVQAVSCSELADLKTIRGDQADAFIVDECQEPNDEVLDALIYRIAFAMLMKRDGRLWVLGTVPDADVCTFTKCLDDPKWRTFGHSEVKGSPALAVFSNPHMPRDIVQKQLDAAGLGPGHPVYEREIMGRRVTDPTKRAYEYLPGRNDYDPATVDFTKGEWLTCWGLDLGFSDSDALTVTKWDRHDPKRQLRAAWWWSHNHLDVDDLADLLLCVRDVPALKPSVVTGDHGGHGAVKVMKTVERRLRMPIRAKPGDVMISVGMVNDDLRTARLTLATADMYTVAVEMAIRKRFAADLAKVERLVGLLYPKERASLPRELGMVTRSINAHTLKAEINKRGFHSDLSESLRYSHAGALHFYAKPPVEKPRAEALRERYTRRRREQRDPYA